MRSNWFWASALISALALSYPASAEVTRAAAAQQEHPVYLIADRVYLDGEDLLVATGNVEARQGDKRLIAQQITYDQANDRLTIDGPIRLEDGDDQVLLADSAALSDDFREGLLRGARLILDRKLQLASVEITRVAGRYNQLSKTSVSSCHVCDDGRPPLWQIRARRVIHDQETRQLYFEQATLRVLDVPVFYLPKMRLPDPTLKRARGFLIPEAISSSTLGNGLKTPYFFPIGDHADVTLTPFLSTETRTLELRYRQKFRNGSIDVNAAGSRDTLRDDIGRSYIFAEGKFDLQRDFKLTFDIETASDNDYLLDYDYSSKDRLDSAIALSRNTRNSSFELSGTVFETLRDFESNDTQASRLGEISHEVRIHPALIGGELRFGALLHEHVRDSQTDIVGRDVRRMHANADWRKSWVFGPGLDLQILGGVSAGFFDVDDDSTLTTSIDYTAPYSAVTLRWPLKKTGRAGGQHIIEPVVQLAWSEDPTGDVPNDESTRVEFDSGNLFSSNRFPAPDRQEDGLRANVGLSWTHLGPDNGYAHLAIGRVIREIEDNRFSESSGLSGVESDWLFEAQIGELDGPLFSARSLLDDQLRLAKAEAQLDWDHARGALSAAYLWLDEDPSEDRDSPASEWVLSSLYELDDLWTSTLSWRYDLVDDRTSSAGLGLTYENECVQVGFSASRRFTSSDTLDPSTNFGLTVSLTGFSAGRSSGAVRRTCKS